MTDQTMLQRIRQRLNPGAAQALSGTTQVPQAAVLIPLTHEAQPRLLLTRRADHLNSHAGEVAFPGGKMDATDTDLLHTALRETFEEVGLPAQAVTIIGTLPSANSRFGLEVTPFVGLIDPAHPLIPNPDELDAIFHVPVQYFLDHDPDPDFEISYQNARYRVPCYRYEGHIIWGLTAFFIGDFINHVFDRQINIKLRSYSRKE